MAEAVDALVKRSKALRFYGLMGKRSGSDLIIQIRTYVFLMSWMQFFDQLLRVTKE